MLSQRLKQLREVKKITQKNLARALSVGVSTVAMWETGVRHPDHEMLVKIADFFGVSVDYLLGRDYTDVQVDINPERIKNMADAELLINEVMQSLNQALADNILTKDQVKQSLEIFRQAVMLLIETKKSG